MAAEARGSFSHYIHSQWETETETEREIQRHTEREAELHISVSECWM